MDVESIAPGLDFVRVLEDDLGQCDIVLTVIGKGWLDARPRLDDPQDFVRIEIETALRRVAGSDPTAGQTQRCASDAPGGRAARRCR